MAVPHLGDVLPGLATLIGATIGFIFGRLAEIAGERRSGYADAAARLCALWDGAETGRRSGLRAELLKLVIGNNPDLFRPIRAFAEALFGHAPDVDGRLVDLIEAMRRTSVLGNVRYRYLGGGGSQRALIHLLVTTRPS